METIDNKLSFNHKRNTATAIIDGYHLFLHHFLALLQRTWPLLTAYSLLTGFIGYYALVELLPRQLSLTTLWPLGVAMLVYAVVIVLMIATIVKAMTEHRSTSAITRGRWYGSASLSEVPTLFKVAARCLRRFWRYLPIALVVLIITILLTLIMESSAIYLGIAHVMAHESAARGDIIMMPDNIGLLTFAVCTLCGFFQALIHTSGLFPFYYFYR